MQRSLAGLIPWWAHLDAQCRDVASWGRMTSILNDSSGGASMGASTHWGMAEHERRHHRLLLPAGTISERDYRSLYPLGSMIERT
ncbi:hypothetical protein CsSME_00005300 [Camellia sinensis var. sinensis]